MYSIQAFSKLTGVTSRTLRYYDEIGLLKPKKMSLAGYRIYGEAEVERMQHILFFRRLGVPLKEIRAVLQDEQINYLDLLKEHQAALQQKQEELRALLELVEQSINEKEGESKMNHQEKFEAFKRNKLNENEEKYGKEIREKYGEEVINQSNQAILGMSEDAYQKQQEREEALLTLLKNSPEMTIPSSEAQKIFGLHKEWITQAWGKYSSQSHKGVAYLYLMNPEFTQYYDEKTYVGGAEKLQQIINYYA